MQRVGQASEDPVRVFLSWLDSKFIEDTQRASLASCKRDQKGSGVSKT